MINFVFLLALSDLLFNTVLLIRGINDILKSRSDWLCLTISFLSHLAELLSACYTVSFTIQRYHAIRCPLEAAARRRSSPIVSLLVIYVLSTIFCLLISYHNHYVDCHEELYLGWFIADASLSFAIPFAFILTFNTLIIKYIRTHSYAPMSAQPTTPLKSGATIVTATTIHSDRNEFIEMTCPNETKAADEVDPQIYPLLTSSVSNAVLGHLN